MKISRLPLGPIVAILVVLALAAGFYLRINSSDEGEDGPSADVEDGDPVASATAAFGTDIATPVVGEEAILDTLVISVHAEGEAAAIRQTGLRSRVEGSVRRVFVRENDAVAAGDTLLGIDAADLELDLLEARHELERSREQYHELLLFDGEIQDAATRQERERVARVRSGLESAELGVERAETQLSRATVVAPFDGRVASIEVVPGHLASQGDDLLTVVDLDPIRVEAQVLEGELVHIERGRRARVRFSGLPGEVFTGVIETTNPLVEGELRSAKVTISIANPDGRMLPGMYAKVALEGQRYPDRILVPREAILERDIDRRTLVMIYNEDGTAEWRYVTVGLQNETHAEIILDDPDTFPVEAGEIVLVDGHYSLIHGARVQLVEDVRAEGGRPR